MHSNDGNKLMKASRKITHTNKRKESGSCGEGGNKSEGGGKWKKKYKQEMKTLNVLKTSMLVLAEEEKTNKSLIYDFQSTQTLNATTSPQITVINAPTPLIGTLQDRFPATSVKIQSIIQNSKYDFILIDNLIRVEHLNCHLIIT